MTSKETRAKSDSDDDDVVVVFVDDDDDFKDGFINDIDSDRTQKDKKTLRKAQHKRERDFNESMGGSLW